MDLLSVPLLDVDPAPVTGPAQLLGGVVIGLVLLGVALLVATRANRRRRRPRTLEPAPRRYDVADAAELEAVLAGVLMAADPPPEEQAGRPVWVRRLDRADDLQDDTSAPTMGEARDR